MKSERYIEIDSEKIYESQIKAITFAEIKMVLSFIDDFKLMYKIANIVDDFRITDYIQELERTCSIREF